MEAQPAEELAPVDLTEMEVQPAEELAPVVDWAAGLPFECHLYLLSFAPLACLGRCTAVCRSWRSLVEDDELWQGLLQTVWPGSSAPKRGKARETFVGLRLPSYDRLTRQRLKEVHGWLNIVPRPNEHGFVQQELSWTGDESQVRCPRPSLPCHASPRPSLRCVVTLAAVPRQHSRTGHTTRGHTSWHVAVLPRGHSRALLRGDSRACGHARLHRHRLGAPRFRGPYEATWLGRSLVRVPRRRRLCLLWLWLRAALWSDVYGGTRGGDRVGNL